MIILRQKEYSVGATLLGTMAGAGIGHSIAKKSIQLKAEKDYVKNNLGEKRSKELLETAERFDQYANDSDTNRKKFEEKVQEVLNKIPDGSKEYLDTFDICNNDGSIKTSKKLRNVATSYRKRANDVLENPEKEKKKYGMVKSSFNPKNAIGGLAGAAIGGIGLHLLTRK